MASMNAAIVYPSRSGEVSRNAIPVKNLEPDRRTGKSLLARSVASITSHSILFCIHRVAHVHKPAGFAKFVLFSISKYNRVV